MHHHVVAFQSPSLRGSGLFRQAEARAARLGGFQSPSLRGSGLFRLGGSARPLTSSRFNPLHCGAVVSSPSPHGGWARRDKKFQSPSLRGSGLFPWPATGPKRNSSCFNPLHCGAVVSSRPLRPPHGDRGDDEFQSPSLRGSGLFIRRTGGPGGGGVFQSPSLRGSGLFPLRPSRGATPRPVSIPFIAGQWSLPTLRRCARG